MTRLLNSLIIAGMMLVLIGFGFVAVPIVERKAFPCVARDMEILVTLDTDQKNAPPPYDSVYEKGGRYSAIWVKVEKTERACKPVHILWWAGERDGFSSPVGFDWGDPKVRFPGLFTAGPWVVQWPRKRMGETYADVYHRRYIFGYELPWLMKSRLYN